MKEKDLFKQLVDKAIAYSKQKHPDIQDGYSFHNITSYDWERLLWYILQNYDDISNDAKLKEMIVASAQNRTIRTTRLNEFLKSYFGDVLAEYDEDLKSTSITEDDTREMLGCILEHFPDVWNDTEFLQGVAMFSRIKPYHWYL